MLLLVLIGSGALSRRSATKLKKLSAESGMAWTPGTVPASAARTASAVTAESLHAGKNEIVRMLRRKMKRKRMFLVGEIWIESW